jgi:outer membrane protein OmpA-like peptidoglycan-associated protein
MTRFTPAALLLGVALTACQPSADVPADNLASEMDNAINVADNGADPPRSILRPEVASGVDTPQIEPADALIGFGASPMALDDAAKVALDTLMISPAMQAGGLVTLRGHSDSHGNDGDNRVASRIRAEKVRDYLIARGLDKRRITIVALGEARPVAPNATEDGKDDPEGRAKNRRVEAHVALPTVMVPPPVVANQSDPTEQQASTAGTAKP